MSSRLAIAGQIMLRKFEKVYVVVSMLFFAGGLIQRAVAENDPTARTGPDYAYQVGAVIIYAILMPLVLFHWREMIQGLLRSGWIIAICFLAGVSSAWSYKRIYTLRHALLLSLLTLFAIYIASCFDWEEQLNLFGWLSVITIVGSCFMAVFIPSYGISQDVHAGAVKGLFPHKNIFGRQVVFAILTLAIAKPFGIPRWFRFGTVVIGCGLLALSNAGTSILAMVACVLMYPILHLLKFSGKKTLPLWVPFVPLFAMGLFLVMSNYGLVVEATGRNNTLTGRIPIWKVVLGEIGKHPWFGYGHDIFWNNFTASLATVRYVLGYLPPHAHNGYLDVLLGMGIVGLIVFLAGLLTSVWRAGTLFRSDCVAGAKWPLLMLVFFAVFNMGESSILRQTTFLWIPYVTIYVSLGLMAAKKHDATADGPEIVGGVAFGTGRMANGVLPGYGT